MKFRFFPANVFLIFIVLAALIYWPAFKAPFYYDDYDLMLNSHLINDIFSLFAQWKMAGFKVVTYLTFAVNYMLGAQDPFGYHLVSSFFHVCNAWLLYFLARVLFRSPEISPKFNEQQKDFVPFAAALIFLVHPVCTSAVNYVWQRAELLTTMFYLAALILYVLGRQKKRFLYFIFVGICFVLGLFSKGTIISLPFVLVLLECALWPVSDKKKRVIIVSLGFVLLMAYLFFAEPWVVHSESYRFVYDRLTGVVLTWPYVWTQLYVTIKYLGLAFFPLNQNFDYDIALAGSFWEPRICLSAFFLLGLIVLAMIAWKSRRFFSVGIFWFLFCLFPAAMMGGREPLWEYRMYLPLAGLTLGIVTSVFQIFNFRKTMTGFLAVAVIFAGLSFSRNLLWQSPEHFLLDNIHKSPRKPNVYQLLGSWYLSQGRIKEAEVYLEKAIALAQAPAESYNNLGLIYKNRGEIDQAEGYFETAIRLRPTLSSAYVNLAYLLLGRGQDQKAEKILRQGLEFGQTEGLYACLAKVYLSRGQLDVAESFLKKSLAINPRAAQAYFWYGQLFAARQDFQNAQRMFQKAVEFNPRLIQLVPREFH